MQPAQMMAAAPTVVHGPQRPLLSALRLHAGAAVLRNLVWLATGDGSDFDDTLSVPTDGLGSGRVRCAICHPRGTHPASPPGRPRPLLLVLEGGGFVLGQPEDGQKHCRRLADEASGKTSASNPDHALIVHHHHGRPAPPSSPSTTPRHRDIPTRTPCCRHTES